MPTAPSYIDKINYIVDFWIDPCNAPLLLYLELALPPAGDALVTWFTYGLADVLRGYARPSKALGGRRSTRKGKGKKPRTRLGRAAAQAGRRGRMLPGFGDDSGGFLGKNLPGAKEFKKRPISQGEFNLWILDDVGQKVLLALLITDIAIDFGYEWATLLDMSEFCQRDSVGSLYATGPGTACGGLFICNAGSAPDVLWSEGNVGWVVATGSVGPRGWRAVSAMKVHNIGPNPVQYHQEAFVQDAKGTRTISSPLQVIGPFASSESILTVPLIGPGAFVVSHCCLGGVVQPDGHDVAIFGGGTRT